MRILSTGYHATLSYRDPQAWLQRIDFYTGILEALAGRHEVHSFEHIDADGELTQGAVRYHFLRFGIPGHRFPVAEHGAARKLRPDAVLVNGLGSPLQVLQLRAALGARPRILLWHRGDKPRSGWRGRLQAIADRAVDGYLFTAAGNAAPWIDAGIIPAAKAHFLMQASSVFLPGDAAAARQTLQIPEGPHFLWVGRLDENKDPLTVLEAFGAVLPGYPNARLSFIFAGGPLQQKLERRIGSDNVLRQAVQLVGPRPHAGLQTWYRSADYFISASHYEGSGIALCEALSCGCIPVYARIPSLAQLAGPLGASFPAGDAGALESALRAALQLDRPAQKAAAIARFQDHFSFAAIARGLEGLLATG